METSNKCESSEILFIDKEEGWTSFDVVAKIRNIKRKQTGNRIKVGHSGTLDPLATGLLIVATGENTKYLKNFEGQDKEYEGAIKIGAVTKSYDREYPEEKIVDVSHITNSDIYQIASCLTGNRQQLIPMFSATYHNGRRMYKLIRDKGVFLKRYKEIHVKSFIIIDIKIPFILFKSHVAKGTYIRSLANEFGEYLGVGAYLYSLRRTKIGKFQVCHSQLISHFT